MLLPTKADLTAAIGQEDAEFVGQIAILVQRQYALPSSQEIAAALKEGRADLARLKADRKAKAEFLSGLLRLGAQVVGGLEAGPLADMLMKGVGKIQDKLKQKE